MQENEYGTPIFSEWLKSFLCREKASGTASSRSLADFQKPIKLLLSTRNLNRRTLFDSHLFREKETVSKITFTLKD